MGNIIIPKTRVSLQRPLIFLEGPDLGAPDWRNPAIEYIFSKTDKVDIASPFRRQENLRKDFWPLLRFGDSDPFPRQALWEIEYIIQALRQGAVMSWLPKQEIEVPGKAYGGMSRVEYGFAMAALYFDKNLRFCVGTDGEFSGFSPMKAYFERFAPEGKIHETLESTCDEAIRLALR